LLVAAEAPAAASSAPNLRGELEEAVVISVRNSCRYNVWLQSLGRP